MFVSYSCSPSPDASILEEVAGAARRLYRASTSPLWRSSILGKWLVIGRTKPGRYPLWGVYYYRWWLAQRLIGLTHVKWFQGSPLMRALSARARREDRRGRHHRRIRRRRDRSRQHRRWREPRLQAEARQRPRRSAMSSIIGTIDIGADAYVGTSCVIEDECRHRRGRRARGSDRRFPPARRSAPMRSGTARRRAQVGDGRRPHARSAIDGLDAATARHGLHVHGAGAGAAAARPAADLPGLLGVRPFRQLARHHRCRPRPLSRRHPALRLADGFRAGARHRGLHRGLPLDRAAARLGGRPIRCGPASICANGRWRSPPR